MCIAVYAKNGTRTSEEIVRFISQHTEDPLEIYSSWNTFRDRLRTCSELKFAVICVADQSDLNHLQKTVEDLKGVRILFHPYTYENEIIHVLHHFSPRYISLDVSDFKDVFFRMVKRHQRPG